MQQIQYNYLHISPSTTAFLNQNQQPMFIHHKLYGRYYHLLQNFGATHPFNQSL